MAPAPGHVAAWRVSQPPSLVGGSSSGTATGAQNLRWNGDEPLVVHDWDSVIAAPEAIVVGMAASVWPCGMMPRAATVPESAAFLDEYQHVSGRLWGPDEVEASWAAGLWVYAYNA